MGKVVLDHITKRYGDHTACSDICLEIEEGDFFTFLGPSGCGKTTILRLIAGFIKPDKGSIFLGNTDITSLEPEKRNVGMVFQNYALFPFMDVQQNIEYGLKIQKKSKAEIRRKSEQYLSLVGLEGFASRAISELSGGEQQRVALARSLAIEPDVLLLDEPLSNLDARLRDAMRAELKSLQKNLGITTIFVTHDQTEALSMSNRLAVFKDGVCRQSGSPEEIYGSPADSFVATFVGDTNLFELQWRAGSCLLGKRHSLAHIQDPSVQYISIRPQDIQLLEEAPATGYSFQGRVTAKQYHGFATEWTIEAEDITFRATSVNGRGIRPGLDIGSPVVVSFSASDMQLLRR